MMAEGKLGAIESQFADLIWENEPLRSPELVKLAEERLHWKKSTTYTVLKRLSQRGLFQNDGGIVTARIGREDFYAAQSAQFVEEAFAGSLPAFVTAFTRRKKLSADEIRQMQSLIDEMREG